MRECDYSSPESVVAAFISAMHAWEVESWDARARARHSDDPSSYIPEVQESQDGLFARFCTPRDRPYGRHGSFQKPPEYDPAREKIIRSGVQSTSRAWVETERESGLGGGRYQYVLHKRGAKWLIDSVKSEDNEKWMRSTL